MKARGPDYDRHDETSEDEKRYEKKRRKRREGAWGDVAPSLGLQLPDPLPSAQGVSRDDRFVELSATGGDAGLGFGLGDQRGDVGQDLGGQEGSGLLGLGGYFCLGGDLLDLPPGHPGLAIAQHHPHPGALGREETEIGRSHEEPFQEEKKEERKTTSRASRPRSSALAPLAGQRDQPARNARAIAADLSTERLFRQITGLDAAMTRL